MTSLAIQLAQNRKTLSDAVERLANQDWEKLGAKHHSANEQVPELVEFIVRPVVEQFVEVTAQHWLEAQNFFTVRVLLEAVRPLEAAVAQLTEYSNTSRAPETHGQARNSLIQSVTNEASQAVRVMFPYLTNARLEPARSNALSLGTISALQAEWSDHAKQLKEQTETALRDANGALDIVRKAAAEDATHRRGKAFRHVARGHQKSAHFWLIISGALALVLLTTVGYVVFGKNSGPPLPYESWLIASNLSHYAARALAVSLFSFLLVVSVRTYRASRHNQITNEHRWGAMTTFAELRAAASENVADAVLLQASQAIFSPQPTGFGDPAIGAPNHVAELIAMIKQTPEK